MSKTIKVNPLVGHVVVVDGYYRYNVISEISPGYVLADKTTVFGEDEKQNPADFGKEVVAVSELVGGKVQ